MIKTIEKIQSFILTIFYFLFPLFFLPFTTDPFTTAKFYLLAFVGLLLLTLSTISILITRKITWHKSQFDAPNLLFILTILISLVFVSPNKISAALNSVYGVISIFFFIIIFIYTSALKNKKGMIKTLNLSFAIVSLLSLISIFQPLKNINIPQQIAFLKSPYFSPIGARIDLIVISLFMAVYWGATIFLKLNHQRPSRPDRESAVKQILNQVQDDIRGFWVPFVFFILYLITFGASIFSIVKPLVPDFTFNLPTYRHSWFAAVEVLKGMLSALFGVGVDNFSSVFSVIKDLNFNQTVIWDNVVNSSRSTILHIFTTTGLFGLLGFGSIVFASLSVIKKLNEDSKNMLLPIYIFTLLALLLSNPTLILFFLFFTVLALINNESLSSSEETRKTYDLKEIVPLHFGLILFLVLFIGTSSYFLGRSYAANLNAYNSLVQLQSGNLSNSYRDMRSAISLNPYNESFRTSFSQTNLLIADAIIRNARKDLKPEDQLNLSENDKLQVSQAVQQAIAEAKSTVTLNPRIAQGWANLGLIYANLLNLTQGSDTWAISSYQRAISLDPNNPAFRMRLGSLYYLLGKYPDATQLFSQAVSLKPDLANAHFNLGWSLYQQKDYQGAASQMQAVMSLLEKDKKSQDYKSAKEAYDNFKKQVELTQQQEQEASQGEQLQLPQQQTPELQPKIDLPESASPEAK